MHWCQSWAIGRGGRARGHKNWKLGSRKVQRREELGLKPGLSLIERIDKERLEMWRGRARDGADRNR